MGICASKEDRYDQEGSSSSPRTALSSGKTASSGNVNFATSERDQRNSSYSKPSISQTNKPITGSSNSSAHDANSVQNEKSNTALQPRNTTNSDQLSQTVSKQSQPQQLAQQQIQPQQQQRQQSQSVGMFANTPTSRLSQGTDHDYKKVLLLGTGESGKSTILQQLKILHSNGFTNEEILEFKPFIFNNITSSVKNLVEAYQTFHFIPEPNDVVSESDFPALLDIKSPSDPNDTFDVEIAMKIKALWLNPSTSQLIKTHGHEFYLMDSAKYFFTELDRISEPNYVPNLTDVIRTRKKTSGIFDFKFELQGLKLQIFDVGGQRSERKKWIHCFDKVASIIFCVSLSEYDQNLLEDKGQNRLEESITLFDSVVNSSWFQRCSVILFLNKIDVFIEKLRYSPLENYFSDYEGGSDANRAAKYILWKFTRVNRSGLPIYPYITQATDTNNMKLVFVVVRESIFSNLLQDTGLL
ncbi:hypothetical protein WICPIJ_008558 [Wickerhamomyces pijperi]|uniref:Guanine nucleotide-binding protein alpha-2 subunit n=1 Tax=Wickerhamomyces pijperi TaxID=599730 RepID=A0A9P8TI67_WICPI|nr:hypothetical protein WICPIJ_008558 [Wickerhamomyces pijperi]